MVDSSFLPTTAAEMAARGWDELDVLFISGDAYIDHPAFGVPLLARLLESRGFRVGIIAQPDWNDRAAFTLMGRPKLCVAVSAGAMDSMVNHYTAARKRRRDDAYTPGGRSGARPNRAVIAYTAAVKGVFKGLPVIIGGIEASLRRLAHYDYWSDKVRRSILVDSKADLLVYGMGETALLEIVSRLQYGADISEICDVPGSAWLAGDAAGARLLPSFEQVAADRKVYAEAFAVAARHSDGALAQRHSNRYVVVNRRAAPLTTAQLDELYALPFTRRPHPGYTETIAAFEQIRWSVTSHRGCQGGCAFCAISSHQGRRVQSRSAASIVAEVERISGDEHFGGTVSDVGGPTANMYAVGLHDEKRCRGCRRDSCLYPQLCSNLIVDDAAAVGLLQRLQALPAVKHVFVASGVRFDLLACQPGYRQQLFEHHVGGLLKVAPEALSDGLLEQMRKPRAQQFGRFVDAFRAFNARRGRKRALVPYLMAGHPGSTLDHMVDTALFLRRYNLRVEQVQEFTPTPGTLATCMYHTGIDPLRDCNVYICRSDKERRLQKALLLYHLPENRTAVAQALKITGRQRDGACLLEGSSRRVERNRRPARRNRRK